MTTLLGALAGDGSAQTPPADRLECFKLQERGTTWTPNPHAADALDVTLPAALMPPFTGFGPDVALLAHGRPVPKELCVAVGAEPSRGPSGSNLGNPFACYLVKYPRSLNRADVPVTDEFGSGVLAVREGRRKLCVPTTIP